MISWFQSLLPKWVNVCQNGSTCARYTLADSAEKALAVIAADTVRLYMLNTVVDPFF